MPAVCIFIRAPMHVAEAKQELAVFVLSLDNLTWNLRATLTSSSGHHSTIA